MYTRLVSLSVFFVLCNAAPPSQISHDQITAIFPAEVYNLRIRASETQINLIKKTVDDHPDNEQLQWSIIRAKEPQLAATAHALWKFMKEKEEQLSPSGKLLFEKLIDGIYVVRFGDPAEIKNYVYETLRLWYAMDLKSKQNFAKILPKSTAGLSNPNLVHYALGDFRSRSQ